MEIIMRQQTKVQWTSVQSTHSMRELIVPQEWFLHFPLRTPLNAWWTVWRTVIAISMILKVKDTKAVGITSQTITGYILILPMLVEQHRSHATKTKFSKNKSRNENKKRSNTNLHTWPTPSTFTVKSAMNWRISSTRCNIDKASQFKN